MRYIILNSKISQNEIIERQKYIKHVFKVYTITKKYKNYIELTSIPSNALDLLIIIGHNFYVYNYLKQNQPSEKNIVLITCYTGPIKSLKLKRKRLYVSKNKNGYSDVFDGSNWNIPFSITDSEITLFNIKENDMITKLEKSFERVI